MVSGPCFHSASRLSYTFGCDRISQRQGQGLPMGVLSGKTGLIFGVANDRSIAWAISEACYDAGAELGFTHLPGDKMERRVRQLADPRGAKMIVPCDVTSDENLDAVFAKAKETYGKIDFLLHSVAF